MGALGLLVEFEVVPDGVERFVELISENARASVRDEAGCSRFDVLRDPEHPARIVLYEVYDDLAAFEVHKTQPHFHAFFAAAKPLIVAQRSQRLTLVAS